MTSSKTPEHPAIYGRISADPEGYAVGVLDQADQGRGFITRHWPDAEITGPGCDCRDCKKFSVPPDVYCDNDITASGKKHRPHYERLLADIEAGRIDAVITSDTDRLHRHPMELEQYINVCEPRKVPTHTIKKGEIDLTTSTGRMVARMLGAAARHEWERMVERQLNAKRRNRDAGLRQAGSAPFGFNLDQRDDRGRQIPGVSKGLVPDERAAGAIRAAADDVLAGISCYSIAGKLNRDGFRGRLGGGWTHQTVRDMLVNPAIAGLIEYDGQFLDAKWDAIIDQDTWRAVRSLLLAKREGWSGSGSKPVYLLTGVLICGPCGGRDFKVRTGWRAPVEYRRDFKVLRTSAGYERARNYICGADKTRPGMTEKITHVSRKVDLLDEYIEGIVIGLLSRPDVLAALNTRPEVNIPALDRRRTEITAELEEWARTPGITPRQLQIKNEPLLAELTAVERQISEGLRGDPLPEFAGNDPAKVWAALKEAGDMERMRAVVRLLLRVRLLPSRRLGGRARGTRAGLDYDAIEILPPDAS